MSRGRAQRDWDRRGLFSCQVTALPLLGQTGTKLVAGARGEPRLAEQREPGSECGHKG